ncbi:MAG: ABC transporter ATP-binding protein [Candidatus Berkelbacteria bacterium]|nr:ABC transporter ATP-binding protein [Candidatus Berkelbacteria bacterium]
MLTISSLKSGYDQMEILRGVDIAVEPGEVVAVIGPNGAGKSTLLKSIFSLAEIYDGSIFFKDRDITKLPTNDLISEGISFVPQGRQVFSNMSVLENLEMGAYIFKDKELMKRNMVDVFEKFSVLKERRRSNASTLSGGQQQLLSIARALIQNPQLLLLDEPSLGLSPTATKEVFEKIVDINAEGVSIVIVEQNIKLALDISDKVYVLKNGEVVFGGNRKSITLEKLEELYFR